MRNASRRRTSLVLEALEERGLMTTIGLAWPDAKHLTLSFAPDGTSVGGAPSVLQQALGARSSSDVWMTTLARAFQSWAAVADINLGLVADNGQPGGLPGPLQGRDGVGDLRVTARPLSANVVGITTPFDLYNSWSGDIVLNSAVDLGDGTAGSVDLFAVALHEAGHALGLEDNATDPTSAMFNQVVPGRTGPSAADAALLRGLYGERRPDDFEGQQGNNTTARATPLAYLATAADLAVGSGQPGKDPVPVAEADLTTSSDVDQYRITIPAGPSRPLTVTVRATGLSLLTMRLTILDNLGQVAATAATTDPLRNDLALTLPSVQAGARFTARVEGSQPGVFAIGGYRIAAGTTALARQAAAAVASEESLLPDDGRNDQFNKATVLKASRENDTAGWTYNLRAEIATSTDVDFYKLRTDRNTSSTMLATVWALDANGLTPRIDVFDHRGQSVRAQLFRRGAFSYTIQVPNVEPNSSYVLRVAALEPSGATNTGRYFLGIDFLPERLDAVTFAAATLDAGRSQDFRTLAVARSQVFHFDLSSDAGDGVSDVGVAMVVYNAANQPVFTLKGVAGADAVSGDVLLAPGTYTVRVRGATREGRALPMTLYTLRGQVRSDPIGPQEVDPTLYPPSGGVTTPPPDPYNWTQFEAIYYTYFLTLFDVYGDPWHN